MHSQEVARTMFRMGPSRAGRNTMGTNSQKAALDSHKLSHYSAFFCIWKVGPWGAGPWGVGLEEWGPGERGFEEWGSGSGALGVGPWGAGLCGVGLGEWDPGEWGPLPIPRGGCELTSCLRCSFFSWAISRFRLASISLLLCCSSFICFIRATCVTSKAVQRAPGSRQGSITHLCRSSITTLAFSMFTFFL